MQKRATPARRKAKAVHKQVLGKTGNMKKASAAAGKAAMNSGGKRGKSGK